jgi:hypothetical protein
VPFSIADVKDQRAALRKIAKMIEKGSIDPDVRRVALKIVADCEGKDDLCELQAIFDAVKHGTDKVPFLRNGVRYVSDPRAADFYTGANRMLSECAHGACAGDCDDHTILVGALCASLGFKVGARAWGPSPRTDLYQHVYCVVWMPKRGPWNAKSITGMDTTVKDSFVGWAPHRGRVLTAVLDGEA